MPLIAAWQARLQLLAEGDKLWSQGLNLRAEGHNLRAVGLKLWAEGDKCRAEGHNLRAEGHNLRAEADKLWADAIRRDRGEIKYEWKCRGTVLDCILETGETFAGDADWSK